MKAAVATRLLGAHMSIAGGLHQALQHGVQANCTAIQIFTKNNNQWNAKPLGQPEINAFKEAIQQTGIVVPLAHCAYLINLASPKEPLWKRSMASMETEVERAGLLGIDHVVLHPGSHTGSGVSQGIQRVADSINLIHEKQQIEKPTILLECMAGQGSSLGSTFEELKQMLDLIRDKSRIGICIDTCHLFAAGYDIRTKQDFAKVFEDFDRIVGLKWIKAFHLNDSKKGLGSHVDRHEHIGQGAIGIEAFQFLLNDSRFSHLPMVLETPKNETPKNATPKHEDGEWDRMNMSALNNLLPQSQKLF